jgi:hypothetical protein
LGKVIDIKGSKITLSYALKSKGGEQTVVRSVRDISIVYSVGEFSINTREHFRECTRAIKPPE